MTVLDSGLRRFQQEVYPELQEHFDGLAESQAPRVLFVTCSDSRVDPSLITQTLPGELFVLRNVGNLVPRFGRDAPSAAVVEYAVRALGIRHVVVCGHSNCGAMQGLLQPKALKSLPTVARWVEHAAPARAGLAALPPEQRLDAAIRANVRQQVEALRSHPAIDEALSDGLVIEGWVYEIGQGRVERVSTHRSEAA